VAAREGSVTRRQQNLIRKLCDGVLYSRGHSRITADEARRLQDIDARFAVQSEHPLHEDRCYFALRPTEFRQAARERGITA